MPRPPSGWTSVVLVGMMLLTVAWAIQRAEYAPGLGILTPAVLCGVVAGALLASQPWLPASLAHGWSMLLGVLGVALLGTRALESYADPARLQSMATSDRLVIVREWYVAWASGAASGSLGRDDPVVPFAFVLTMAFLLWLLSYICTWFVVRYLSWWGAVLPSGFALAFNLYQAPEERLIGLAFFLACGLVLAGQMHYALQVDYWRRARIGFSPDIGIDFFRDGLVVVLVVVGLGWLAPTHLDRRPLSRVVEYFTGSGRGVEQRFQQLFPSLNYPTRGGGTAFGDDMALGGSIKLGTQAIFEAQVAGARVEPRYFRMTVFDLYDGRGWRRAVDGKTEGDRLDLSDDATATAPVTQTIRTFVAGTRQLYAMPQPDRFSMPVRVELAQVGRERQPVTVESLDALPVAGTYLVVSRQSFADVPALRSAGADDPAGVRERYLSLPPSLPQRVVDLAGAVTDGASNRYDAASRIEAYLRQSYDYSEEITDPPDGRDRVDWFLFDEMRGYCDYFSSSFVVLARAAGVPARVAAGYSRGRFVAESNAWRQHESDAHTWPEVFFPGYGWIEFEPTPGDAPLERPGTDDRSDPSATEQAPDGGAESDFMEPDERIASSPDGAAEPGATGDAGSPLGRQVLALLALLGATGLAAAIGVSWWRRPFAGLTAAQGAFARLARVAAWLGLGPRPSDTPHEYGRRLGEAIPEGSGDISSIVEAYVRERFGRRPSHPSAVGLAAAWRRLRRGLARAATRVGVSRLRRR